MSERLEASDPFSGAGLQMVVRRPSEWRERDPGLLPQQHMLLPAEPFL